MHLCIYYGPGCCVHAVPNPRHSCHALPALLSPLKAADQGHSHHLTLLNGAVKSHFDTCLPHTVTKERQVPEMGCLNHPPEASFSSREPRFSGTILRTSFTVSHFWLLGRKCIILSQWIIYSEAFSKSEDLLWASAELLGKFALCRTANTKRTKLRSVQLQQ